jgi:hypothetical protein
MVVMDLLSNVALMGTGEEGIPISAIRGHDSKFHIVGSLTAAPPTALKKNLAVCEPLVAAVGDANLILTGSTPC